MKKYIFILLAAMAFVACSEDEGNELIGPVTEASADEIPLNVKAFFNDYVSENYEVRQGISFNFGSNKSLAINSMGELSQLYTGTRELPNIDFGKYTLILGNVLLPHSGHYYEKSEMEEYDSFYQMDVYIKVFGKTKLTTKQVYGVFPITPRTANSRRAGLELSCNNRCSILGALSKTQ